MARDLQLVDLVSCLKSRVVTMVPSRWHKFIPVDTKVRIWNTAPVLNEEAEEDPNCHKLLCTMTMHNGMQNIYISSTLTEFLNLSLTSSKVPYFVSDGVILKAAILRLALTTTTLSSFGNWTGKVWDKCGVYCTFGLSFVDLSHEERSLARLMWIMKVGDLLNISEVMNLVRTYSIVIGMYKYVYTFWFFAGLHRRSGLGLVQRQPILGIMCRWWSCHCMGWSNLWYAFIVTCESVCTY
jgi:hypothetical protein